MAVAQSVLPEMTTSARAWVVSAGMKWKTTATLGPLAALFGGAVPPRRPMA